MTKADHDTSVPAWNAEAFSNRWRPGMFVEINDYRGSRSQWKRKRLILLKKISSEVWSAIELTSANRRTIVKGKIPKPSQITLEYITTPHIHFICDQLPQDPGH